MYLFMKGNVNYEEYYLKTSIDEIKHINFPKYLLYLSYNCIFEIKIPYLPYLLHLEFTYDACIPDKLSKWLIYLALPHESDTIDIRNYNLTNLLFLFIPEYYVNPINKLPQYLVELEIFCDINYSIYSWPLYLESIVLIGYCSVKIPNWPESLVRLIFECTYQGDIPPLPIGTNLIKSDWF